MREPLLTPREAAKLLAIHYDTILRWAKAGRIPFVRIGTRPKFKPSDIDKFINQREVQS